MYGSVYSQQYNESNDFSYALKLYNEGFYDIAAQQFSSFINNYPNSDKLAEATYYLADALYKLKDLENSRIEFQSLAVSFPNHSRAPLGWKMVGEIYYQQGRYEDAAKAFETVKVLYSSNPLAPPSLLGAAESYINIKDFNNAERILLEFLDRYVESSEYPQGRLVYGKLLREKGQYNRSIQEFNKVLNTTENEELIVQANYEMAVVYSKLGLPSQSITYYRKAISQSRSSNQAFLSIKMLTRIFHEIGDFQEAISLIKDNRKYHNARQKQYDLNILLLQSNFLSGDYFTARQICDKLMSEVVDDSKKLILRFYLAACYREEGNADRAIVEYEAIARIGLRDTSFQKYQPAVLTNLSSLYIARYDLQKARQYIYDFQNNFPQNQNAEKLLFDLIEKAFQTKNFALALEETDKFNIKYPHSIFRDDLIYIAGSALFKAKKYSVSYSYFQKLNEQYYCNENADSVLLKLQYIRAHTLQSQEMGVSRLAGLMAKMLAEDDRSNLLMELGKVYLEELKDFESAAGIFRKCLTLKSDSSYLGKAAYFLSESNIRRTEAINFPRKPSNSEKEMVLASLKNAMIYLKFSPHPDSLTFRFLKWSKPETISSPDKYIEFWQHFERTYSNSNLLPVVRLRLANLFITQGSTQQALEYFDKIISNDSDSYYAGIAYWERAQLLEKNGELSDASQVLKDFLLNIPEHPYQARAYWKLAEMNTDKNEYLLAAQFLERLIQLFEYSNYSGDAMAKIAEYYILGGSYSQAFNYVQSQIIDREPIDDQILKQYISVPHLEFYFFAGKAKYYLAEYDESKDYLFQYLTLANERKYQAETFFILGEIAKNQGDAESALLYFSLVSNGDNSTIYHKANESSADILFNIGEYAPARKRYDELASSTQNTDTKIFYDSRKLKCLINESNIKVFSSELVNFRKAYDKHPQMDEHLASFEFENGKKEYQNKKFDSALRHFSTIQKKYKKTEFVDDALYYEGLCYTTLNKVDDAEKRLTKFIKEYSNSPLLGDVYNTMGNLYLRGEQTDPAMAAFRKAVETASNPESKSVAMSNLIRMYKNLGLWDSALQLSREYIKEFPNAPDIIDKKILVGICLSSLNRYSEAVDYLKKTKFVASSEQEPEIQFYIGEAYFNAGQYENAIGEFVKIPLLSKKTKLQWEASALYYSGQAYEKLGRLNDAVRMYTEIVERPGILIELKREAKNRIDTLTN
jgi:tetratricopeptide (TPR) repeat protein